MQSRAGGRAWPLSPSWAEGAEVELAIWSLNKCFLTLQLLSPPHNDSHLWKASLWNHTQRSCSVWARLCLCACGFAVIKLWLACHWGQWGVCSSASKKKKKENKKQCCQNLLAAERKIWSCVPKHVLSSVAHCSYNVNSHTNRKTHTRDRKINKLTHSPPHVLCPNHFLFTPWYIFFCTTAARTKFFLFCLQF